MRINRVLAALVITALTLGLGACSSEQASARSKQKIPLRIGVLQSPEIIADPVAATGKDSEAFIYNTFQRLMTVESGTGLLKPDAAAECLFIDEVTYSCTLNTQMQFTNGNKLTASDVKFSIDRAKALSKPGTSGVFLDTLEEAVIVEEDRVDFKLNQPDNQFGHVLASPAASIVDEEVYSATKIRPSAEAPVGSGPVQVIKHTEDELGYWSNTDYRGRNPAQTINQVIRTFDSPEEMRRAAEAGELDAIWDAAAMETIPEGFHEDRFTNGRVQWLRWNPESKLREQADVREYVRDAVQPMRSMRSILPRGTDTAVPVFDTGQRQPRSPRQASLKLWHEDLPDQEVVAENVASLLEEDQAVTVELTTKASEADLYLEDVKPWVRTPIAWFQPYLEDPLPGTEERNAQAVAEMRSAFTQPRKQEASTRLQQYVHDDATVVPLTVEDQRVHLGPTVELSRENEMENYMAPGFQLGVWGFSL
ncbi:ABC transporter substrate-binding protein [Propioniferax innocua]|uniref:Peptide/nickel transport system substrate-binding protein n=1 Tax=Propioniferax innocua TaxID=1753 RepID=A0A542ZQ33_9ACTN|nr:ABC transporter substrate-binding protein [Propioniferax innocua]TQL62320.1 peptide/nickel transport system substrate-binding protein [Propioniferax innocua]